MTELAPETSRVAVVGAGNMAREHIRAFQDVPGVAVAGLHSRTRARAESLARELGVSGVYDSVAELYEKTRAQIVVVTVFELSMRDVALACLAFPWTVMLEKPPGLSLAEALEIDEAARGTGRDVRVGLNRQFLGSTQHVLAQLGETPGPRFVKVQDQQSLALAESLGHPPEVVRHWMYANSIHLVDYFRVLARGAVEAIEPIVAWNPAAPGVVLTKLSFDSGDLGLYEAVWHGPGPWAASVTVPGRRWELRPLEQATTQALGERPETLALARWDSAFKPGFRRQAEQLVEAARGRSSEAPTLGEAIQTMRLIARIYPHEDGA